MTSQFPITPPPELVRQWETEWHFSENTNGNGFVDFVATRAAQWGADQELDACCQWISDDAEALRIVRRPKPLSLAEEALIGLEMIDECAIDQMRNYVGFDELFTHKDTIRRALERLQELEGGN